MGKALQSRIVWKTGAVLGVEGRRIESETEKRELQIVDDVSDFRQGIALLMAMEKKVSKRAERIKIIAQKGVEKPGISFLG